MRRALIRAVGFVAACLFLAIALPASAQVTWTGEFHPVNFQFNGTTVNWSAPLEFRVDSAGRISGTAALQSGGDTARGDLSGQASNQSFNLSATMQVQGVDAEIESVLPGMRKFVLTLTSNSILDDSGGLAVSGTGTLNGMDPACMADLARALRDGCGRIDIQIVWSASGPSFAASPTPGATGPGGETVEALPPDIELGDDRLPELIALILALGGGALAGALGAALGGALAAMGQGQAWWLDDLGGGDLSSLGVEPPELPWLKLSGEDLDNDAARAAGLHRKHDGSIDFDALSRHFGDIYGLPPGGEKPPWMDDETFENANRLRTLAIARAAELDDLAQQGIYPLPPRTVIADLPPVPEASTPAPGPAPDQGPRVENPFDGGKPLPAWRPGAPADGDGNPGEPGQVLLEGHWVDADTARERFAASLDLDRQRAADADAHHREGQAKSAKWMQDRVEEGEREALQRAEAELQEKADDDRRAALAEGIEDTLANMPAGDARRALLGQLGEHMQNGDTDAVRDMWGKLRGERQAQIDGYGAEAQTHLDDANRADWAAWGAEKTLNGSKAIFGAAVGGMAASPAGLIAAAAWGVGGLGTIGAVEGGLVSEGGEVRFDGAGAVKGFAGGAKAGILAAIGGIQSGGNAAIAVAKLGSQAALDAGETYARTGDPYKAFTSGAISAAGNALGEVIDGSVANGLARGVANHAANLAASTAEGVNQGQSLGEALKAGLEGEVWGVVARGTVKRAHGADGAAPTIDGDYDPARAKADASGGAETGEAGVGKFAGAAPRKRDLGSSGFEGGGDDPPGTPGSRNPGEIIVHKPNVKDVYDADGRLIIDTTDKDNPLTYDPLAKYRQADPPPAGIKPVPQVEHMDCETAAIAAVHPDKTYEDLYRTVAQKRSTGEGSYPVEHVQLGGIEPKKLADAVRDTGLELIDVSLVTKAKGTLAQGDEIGKYLRENPGTKIITPINMRDGRVGSQPNHVVVIYDVTRNSTTNEQMVHVWDPAAGHLIVPRKEIVWQPKESLIVTPSGKPTSDLDPGKPTTATTERLQIDDPENQVASGRFAERTGGPTQAQADAKATGSEQSPANNAAMNSAADRIQKLQEVNRDRTDAIRELSKTDPNSPNIPELNAQIDKLAKEREVLQQGMSPEQIADGKLRPLHEMDSKTLQTLPPPSDPHAESDNIIGVTKGQVAELRDEVAKLPGALQATAMGSRTRVPDEVAAADSYRRDPARKSDVDVLVVCSRVDKDTMDAAQELGKKMSERLGKEINIVPVTPEDYSRGPEWHKIPGVEIK